MQEDIFYIILTIEETQYEGVEVPISNPFLTIQEQIEWIVEFFMLPKMDKFGNPVTYLLGRMNGDDWDNDILEFDDEYGREQCLLDYNICPGDHLCLISRPIAGGGREVETFESEACFEEDLSTFGPKQRERLGPLRRMIGGLHNKRRHVYSSVFAPAEICFETTMLVQVYLHRYDETEMVKAIACESQPDAKRRDYIPLQCTLNRGDKVDILLNIMGNKILMSERKSVVWQGSFTKCSFSYFVPHTFANDLSCMVLLMVNGIPIGEMRFVTRLSFSPRKLNPEVVSHKYEKVFISYSHKDELKVKSFHEGLKLCNIDHFFDRSYLKAGDIYPQVIQNYIDSADLFVLFWSENAANSEYVQKEREQALKRAFPQVKPQEAAKLTIYPMSIEPRTELPSDMKYNYHFGEM